MPEVWEYRRTVEIKWSEELRLGEAVSEPPQEVEVGLEDAEVHPPHEAGDEPSWLRRAFGWIVPFGVAVLRTFWPF